MITNVTEEPRESEPAAGASLEAGWYLDRAGRHSLRYWDGERWTYAVHDEFGGLTRDPSLPGPPTARPRLDERAPDSVERAIGVDVRHPLAKKRVRAGLILIALGTLAVIGAIIMFGASSRAGDDSSGWGLALAAGLLVLPLGVTVLGVGIGLVCWGLVLARRDELAVPPTE